MGVGRGVAFGFGALIAVASAIGVGCGGGDAAGDAEHAEHGSGGERRADKTTEPDDGLVVEGIRGTLPQQVVDSALQNRHVSFQKCFMRRYDEVDVLAGAMDLSFVVAIDGTVKDVYATRSNVGDRETEVCVIEAAKSAKFPRPEGGEAEFAWTFGMDGMEDVRPPVPLDSTAATATLEKKRRTLDDCRPYRGVEITAYIAPSGEVISAGASPTSRPDTIECVIAAIKQWTFPAPGSYPAKILFSL